MCYTIVQVYSIRLLVLLSLIYLLVIPPIEANPRIGTGVGIPYGTIGINLEVDINEFLTVTGGLGSLLFDDITGKVFGLRYYPFTDQDNIRFGLMYGTNAIVRDDDCDRWVLCIFDDKEFKGYILTAGWQQKGHDGGWNIDLVYILTSDVFDYIDEIEDNGGDYTGNADDRWKISFGYHW